MLLSDTTAIYSYGEGCLKFSHDKNKPKSLCKKYLKRLCKNIFYEPLLWIFNNVKNHPSSCTLILFYTPQFHEKEFVRSSIIYKSK